MHPQDAAADQDCAFDSKVIFTDVFGSSNKSPWLLCAIESSMTKLGNNSVTVLTDNLDDFAVNWPSKLPNPGRVVSVSKCLEGTPLRGWLDSPELASSRYRQQNIANALRLAALYKSGGIYLDLDIIPLHKELFESDLASISQQCEESECGNAFFLNNAYLSFPAKDRFLHKLMETFVVEYQGSIWGFNGPRLVSSLYKRLLCDGPAGIYDCHKLKILPIERLAPFDWDEIVPVLSSQPDESYSLLVDNPHILAIHAYHNVWKTSCIPRNSVFHHIMSDHCPIVSSTFEDSIYCEHQV
ncbi:TPA: hypothetical protein ACH3X2_010652 [Trebouxia sp. C0005]